MTRDTTTCEALQDERRKADFTTTLLALMQQSDDKSIPIDKSISSAVSQVTPKVSLATPKGYGGKRSCTDRRKSTSLRDFKTWQRQYFSCYTLINKNRTKSLSCNKKKKKRGVLFLLKKKHYTLQPISILEVYTLKFIH